MTNKFVYNNVILNTEGEFVLVPLLQTEKECENMLNSYYNYKNLDLNI